LPSSDGQSPERWKMTLRKHDTLRRVDFWWEEEFDAVILANGHYAVPYVGFLRSLKAIYETCL
jgi:cation diffusion facilitator CzcD-associated flavoprotein CzcO